MSRQIFPALTTVRARLEVPISVPTHVLMGGRDMRREMIEPQRRYFTGDYEWTVVPDTGHFLHREAPDRVNALLLDWLSR